MFPSSVGIVLAALVGANVPVGGDLVQQAVPETVTDTVLQALPPPPESVVRETYFGKVTIDHRAHLKRRAACVGCHGSGRVTKIEFTPKIAHERCVGCHKEQQAGPVQCAGCHVKPPAPADLPEGLQVGAPAGSASRPVAAVSAASKAQPGSAAEASASLPPPPPPPSVATPAPSHDPGRFQGGVQFGWSAGNGLGPALRVSSRQGSFAMTHSFDRIAGDGETRTLGLVGFGVTRPLPRRWRAEAVALGGFDLVENPRLAWLPALGARAGVEWWAGRWMFRNVQLSVTGVVDLSGAPMAGTTVFGTVSTGLSLSRRP